MTIDEKELSTIYLKPGEVYFGGGPVAVMTVLGSCVSVTMFHPGSGTGAICHGLLPQCGGKRECDGTCMEGFRYVDCCIKRLLKRFETAGIRRMEIEVKIFGGADMFGVSRGEKGRDKTVGRENVKVARRMIESEGLEIKASDTGGSQGRKLVFLAHTGEVYLKRLRSEV